MVFLWSRIELNKKYFLSLIISVINIWFYFITNLDKQHKAIMSDFEIASRSTLFVNTMV